jgi:peptidoglycan/LPS O-acetylase OafA/YrhL
LLAGERIHQFYSGHVVIAPVRASHPIAAPVGAGQGMTRDVSTFLDAARLTAALIVVAGHTEWSFAPGFMPFIRSGHLATLAVGVFFVLSGFVISYVVDQKEITARRYFVSRAARVYSVALPALMLTLLLDCFGRYLSPRHMACSIYRVS